MKDFVQALSWMSVFLSCGGRSRVEVTPAATITASSGMATSTKKRSFMDRQDGATKVDWSSNEELGITESTPSKEPANKKPRTMPPTPDRVLVLPTNQVLVLPTDKLLVLPTD
ncbi:hypothetical protein LTR17_014711 [Elasticomyces elasticus]|nr:hypothetical protein LTR17_014711 [Elasticomyces elasticus]